MRDHMLHTEVGTLLGPAEVLDATNSRLRLRIAGEERDAVLALPYPYRASPGDLVLAISQDDRCYVIGVLHGTGATVYSGPGDLELRAPKGKIRLVSPRGVSIEAPQVTVRAGRLELLARTMTQKATSLVQWVRETLRVRAERVEQRVSGEFEVRAERIVERAAGHVSIDGERINLG